MNRVEKIKDKYQPIFDTADANCSPLASWLMDIRNLLSRLERAEAAHREIIKLQDVRNSYKYDAIAISRRYFSEVDK